MKTVRHPPSRELWRFCMDRLRELRGPDTRERDLANILGFEHSRAVRWKEGQMYVDRAEYLLRLADSLEVEPMMLVNLAAGITSPAEAQRQLARIGRGEDAKKKAARSESNGGEVRADTARATVLLIGPSAESEVDLEAVVSRHGDVAAVLGPTLSIGLQLAERHRPELVFLDMGAANVHAFDACRALSALNSRTQRKPRLIAGTTAVTDEIEKPALMAGATHVVLLPFARPLFESELDRLEERLGPRKNAKK